MYKSQVYIYIYVCVYMYTYHVIRSVCTLWCDYDSSAPLNHRSLLQNVVSFIRLFCKRDL